MSKSKISEQIIVFDYTIYGDPPSQKNSKRIMKNIKTGRPILIKSSKFYRWEKDVLRQAKDDKVPKLNIDYPVMAEILVYRKNKHGGVGDVPNFIQAPLDFLVKVGVLKDDNRDIVFGVDGSRLFFDYEKPRIEIKLYKI